MNMKWSGFVKFFCLVCVLFAVSCSDSKLKRDSLDKPGDSKTTNSSDTSDKPPKVYIDRSEYNYEFDCERDDSPCDMADVSQEALDRTAYLAGKAMEMLNEGKSLLEIADWLATQEDMAGIYVDERGLIFRIQDGIPTTIMKGPSTRKSSLSRERTERRQSPLLDGSSVEEAERGSEGSPDVAKRRQMTAPPSRSVVGTNASSDTVCVPKERETARAIVLNPWKDHWGDNDETGEIQSILQSIPRPEYEITYHELQQANHQAFKGWDGYDVIYIAAHGGFNPDFGLLSRHVFDGDTYELAMQACNAYVLGLGRQEGRGLLCAGSDDEVVLNISLRFFQTQYEGKLSDKLIFVSACHSMETNDFARALVGADDASHSIVFGWTHVAASGHINEKVLPIFRDLAKGYDTAHAYERTCGADLCVHCENESCPNDHLQEEVDACLFLDNSAHDEEEHVFDGCEDKRNRAVADGTRATVDLIFTKASPDEEAVIPEETWVRNSDDVVFVTNAELRIASGKASGKVKATALDTGDEGNVAAHSLKIIVAFADGETGVQGDVTVNNPEAASGGDKSSHDYDLENDDSCTSCCRRWRVGGIEYYRGDSTDEARGCACILPVSEEGECAECCQGIEGEDYFGGIATDETNICKCLKEDGFMEEYHLAYFSSEGENAAIHLRNPLTAHSRDVTLTYDSDSGDFNPMLVSGESALEPLIVGVIHDGEEDKLRLRVITTPFQVADLSSIELKVAVNDEVIGEGRRLNEGTNIVRGNHRYRRHDLELDLGQDVGKFPNPLNIKVWLDFGNEQTACQQLQLERPPVPYNTLVLKARMDSEGNNSCVTPNSGFNYCTFDNACEVDQIEVRPGLWNIPVDVTADGDAFISSLLMEPSMSSEDELSCWGSGFSNELECLSSWMSFALFEHELRVSFMSEFEPYDEVYIMRQSQSTTGSICRVSGVFDVFVETEDGVVSQQLNDPVMGFTHGGLVLPEEIF